MDRCDCRVPVGSQNGFSLDSPGAPDPPAYRWNCHRMLRVDLPVTDYLQALEIQRTLVERQIALGGPDVLILLEHPATITLGTRGNSAHLLALLTN